MLECGVCHLEVKRVWKCGCNKFLAPNDIKINELQPFVSKLNGWGNFLNFVKVSLYEQENPSRPIPKQIEVHIPDEFEPNLDAAMKIHILRVLHLHEGNKSAAAAALGISVKTIYNKLESWGMYLPETMRIEQ